jgi:hypothetical protein
MSLEQEAQCSQFRNQSLLWPRVLPPDARHERASLGGAHNVTAMRARGRLSSRCP